MQCNLASGYLNFLFHQICILIDAVLVPCAVFAAAAADDAAAAAFMLLRSLHTLATMVKCGGCVDEWVAS